MGKALVLAEGVTKIKSLVKPFKHEDLNSHFEVHPCDVFSEGAIFIHVTSDIYEMFSPSDYPQWEGKKYLEQLPLIIEDFKFKIIDSDFFQLIKKCIDDPSVSTIIHGGDPNYLGEILITQVLSLAENKKPIKRFWSYSLTKQEIIKGFKQLKDIQETLPYYQEGIARQQSDWIMRTNFSRLIPVLLEKNQTAKLGTFSIGREEPALLSIIHSRENEIKNFHSEAYWDVYATFHINGCSFKGKWFTSQQNHIYIQAQAEELIRYCENKPIEIYKIKTSERECPPPQFYNLPSLQIEAVKRLGISPSEVLSAAESLYHKGLITFPLVEEKRITEQAYQNMPKILKSISAMKEYQEFFSTSFQDIKSNSRYVTQKTNANQHGILTTGEPIALSTLPLNEQAVYDLIVKSILAAHYPVTLYKEEEIITVIDDKFTFQSLNEYKIQNGWMDIYYSNQSDGDRKGKVNKSDLGSVLSKVEKGEVLFLEFVSEHTQPKKFYSIDELIEIMGSENSFASIEKRVELINGLIYKRFIKGGNELSLTTKGRLLLEILGVDGYLTSVTTARKMENYLLGIRRGKNNYVKFIKRTNDVILQYTNKLIKEEHDWNFSKIIEESINESIGTCIECSEPVIDSGNYFECFGYQTKKCEFRLPKQIGGKELTMDSINSLLEKGTTPLIKGFKSKKTDAFFDAYLVWSKEEKSLKYKRG